MAAERLLMRQVREILRLKFECGNSVRQIARAVGGAGRSTVSDYLARFAAAGLAWPLPADMDDEALDARLFARTPTAAPRVLPDFATMDVELRKRGVTLQLLWTEYRAVHGESGYQFSRYCELYGEWRKRQRLWMRQDHKAGDKLFVDYSGDGLEIVDALTGEVKPVKLYVAALGASSYTFARATPDETLPNFVDCTVRAFEFFGGATAAVVPDNLKSAVVRPDRYEPTLNETFAEMGCHYGTSILPARSRKPRDKAKVEVAVQVAQRWIVAVLRHRTFYTLDDLNDAIAELVERLNQRVMRHIGRSRAQLFADVDQPALKPLPVNRYECADWLWARVAPNYHVDVHKHFYSVPHIHRGADVLVRVGLRTVEVSRAGVRIAAHARSRRAHHYTTLPEHMPPNHLHQADSTVEKLRTRASHIGPSTALLFEKMIAQRRHPEHAVRGFLGVLSLCKAHGSGRVEAACERAVRFGSCSYQAVKNILVRGLDNLPPDDEQPQISLPHHDNIRGKGYFH